MFKADVVFLLGREEERIYAHRLILMSRCKSFQVASGVSGEESFNQDFVQHSQHLFFKVRNVERFAGFLDQQYFHLPLVHRL